MYSSLLLSKYLRFPFSHLNFEQPHYYEKEEILLNQNLVENKRWTEEFV